jgi:hypothetical protein
VDTVHVFPTLFGGMHLIYEVAVEKVRQHGADPLPALPLFCYKQSGASFSLSFLFSLYDDAVFLFVFSVYIGTIKLFTLISTCKWLVMLEKVKVVPHL